MKFDPFPPVQSQIDQFSSVVSGPIADMDFYTQSLLFAELSTLAYFNFDSVVKWCTALGFTELKTIQDNGGLAYVFENDTDIVISFRGTDNLLNIQTDFDGALVKDGHLVGRVHNGFMNLTNRIWKLVAEKLDDNDSAKKLWVTGHSLGGAIAAIIGVRAERRTGPNVAGVWTFGQPRIGNSHYVKGITTPYYRWVNNYDIISKTPMWWMTYCHFGKLYYFKNGGILSKQPIWERLLMLPSFESVTDHNIVEYRNLIANLLVQNKK